MAIRILLISFFLTLNLSKAQSFDEFVDEGNIFHNKFNNTSALKQYQKAYEIDPNSLEVLKKLVLTSNDCGEDFRETDEQRAKAFFKKSIVYAELAKKKYPGEPDIHFLLAISYGNLARYTAGKEKLRLARDVEKNLKKMIQLKPDFAPSYVALGVYYREVAKLNWVLKMFAKTMLGNLPNGTLEDSKDILQKALSIDPSMIVTHFELAKTYLELKDLQKAAYHFDKVLELPVEDHQDKDKKMKAEKNLENIYKKI